MDQNLSGKFRDMKYMADTLGLGFGKNFDKMARMAELMSGGGQKDGQRSADMTLLEGSAQQNAMNSIKSSVPVLDARYREMLSLFVKMVEIKSMLEVYGQAALANNESGDWRGEFLTAMRPYVSQESHPQLDKMIQAFAAYNVLKEMKAIMEE